MKWVKHKSREYTSEKAIEFLIAYEIRCYPGTRRWYTYKNGVEVDNAYVLHRDLAKAKVDDSYARRLAETPIVDLRTLPRDEESRFRKVRQTRRTKAEIVINKQYHCDRCGKADHDGAVLTLTPVSGKEQNRSLCGQCVALLGEWIKTIPVATWGI